MDAMLFSRIFRLCLALAEDGTVSLYGEGHI